MTTSVRYPPDEMTWLCYRLLVHERLKVVDIVGNALGTAATTHLFFHSVLEASVTAPCHPASLEEAIDARIAPPC